MPEVKAYFLSQLRKLLILIIRSHCKICPSPITQTREIALLAMGESYYGVYNEQNQVLAELRQKVLVLERGLPSLDCKRTRFVTKKW